MPPGLVSVNDAPCRSSAPSLLSRALRDQLFVACAKRREVERVGVLDDRDDQKARAVLALAVDGQTEMDARLDPRRRAVLVAAERIRDERHLARGAHQRVRDEVRERNLLGAAGGFERAVEFFAPRVEHVDRQRAETRRRRNREALLHVAGERGGRAFQRRHRRAGRNRRQRAAHGGGELRRALLRLARRRRHAGSNRSGPDPRTRARSTSSRARHAARGLIREARSPEALRAHGRRRGGLARFAPLPVRPAARAEAPSCLRGSISASDGADGDRSPSRAEICVTTAGAVAGTSTSTLSVVTSTNGSPSATKSPTRLRHSTIEPSVTDSPISGSVTLTTFVPKQASSYLCRAPEAYDYNAGREKYLAGCGGIVRPERSPKRGRGWPKTNAATS